METHVMIDWLSQGLYQRQRIVFLAFPDLLNAWIDTWLWVCETMECMEDYRKGKPLPTEESGGEG